MLHLRIIIGDNDEKFLINTSAQLKNMGYNVVDTDNSGSSLIRKIRTLKPDVVLVDVNLKGISGFEISNIVEGEEICPCVIMLKGNPSEYAVKLQQKLIYAYLQKPLIISNIEYVIDNAYISFKKIIELNREIKERKTIEKAKGLLIKNYNMTEDKAYEYMRKKSMDKSISMYKIALAIIDIINKKENI
ncbi:MAG: ANTAR domain-containing protein [Caloramator sp.]|nr:ANTAR domain-containing protein [Caloramator sp.]